MADEKNIREMSHAFNVGIAMDYGIPAALLYHDIDYWCRENALKNQNVRDGCAWIYRSLTDFKATFPYLKEYGIRQGLSTLENAGLIRSANYNRLNLDRTKWYTTQVELFNPTSCGNPPQSAATCSESPSPHLSKSTDGLLKTTDGDTENDGWIPGFQQMDMQKTTDGLSKTINPSVENDRPIPSITTSITPSITESQKTSGKTTQTSSSTGGSSSATARPTTTTLSSSHVKFIQSRTTDFDMDELQELVSLGGSEVMLALKLYNIDPDHRWPWKSIYEEEKKRLTR